MNGSQDSKICFLRFWESTESLSHTLFARTTTLIPKAITLSYRNVSLVRHLPDLILRPTQEVSISWRLPLLKARSRSSGSRCIRGRRTVAWTFKLSMLIIKAQGTKLAEFQRQAVYKRHCTTRTSDPCPSPPSWRRYSTCSIYSRRKANL